MNDLGRMFRNNSKSKRPRRIFSIAFFLAIPGNFIIGIMCLVGLIILAQITELNREIWSVFAIGLVGGLSIIGTSEIRKLRTAIHEFKHAIVVSLTGNRLKDISIQKDTGYVDYELYQETVHFAPMIILAPYFFPLLSAPALVCCLIFEDHYRTLCTLILGFTLAADLSTAYTELHPHQSDLRQVCGGFFAAASYLAGFHLMWITVCLLWI
ncbi:MAG TPA: M50 family metallopeptidase, partial [Oligoflexia bacterium]|nr:M50 family metallopeptidase [Oligoflexia bacterium]